jgi:hypothetical protein
MPMAFVFYNPNPKGIRVGDCAVRAVSKALGKDWVDTYIGLCSEGLIFRDMPNSNYVWGMYLKKNGFEEKMISSVCPNCTTVSKFAKEHPKGTYVLACQNHVVCIDSSDIYDSWDSSGETVLYYYEKEI